VAASISIEIVAAGATFFSEFNNDVSAHEGLAIEVCYSILSILGVLELDEPKARHDAAVDDTTIALEKF